MSNESKAGERTGQKTWISIWDIGFVRSKSGQGIKPDLLLQTFSKHRENTLKEYIKPFVACFSFANVHGILNV
jgi:hypothetical protein